MRNIKSRKNFPIRKITLFEYESFIIVLIFCSKERGHQLVPGNKENNKVNKNNEVRNDERMLQQRVFFKQWRHTKTTVCEVKYTNDSLQMTNKMCSIR